MQVLRGAVQAPSSPTLRIDLIFVSLNLQKLLLRFFRFLLGLLQLFLSPLQLSL